MIPTVDPEMIPTVDPDPITDAVRELISEAAEYAGPTDDDLSNNAAIWKAIDEAEQAVLKQPLVVLDLTGGVVQSEYTYPGIGKPLVYTLDFDREESDIDERHRFAEKVDEVCDLMRRRSSHPDDLAQIAEWHASARDLLTWDEEERGPDLNPEGDPTRNGAFGV